MPDIVGRMHAALGRRYDLQREIGARLLAVATFQATGTKRMDLITDGPPELAECLAFARLHLAAPSLLPSPGR